MWIFSFVSRSIDFVSSLLGPSSVPLRSGFNTIDTEASWLSAPHPTPFTPNETRVEDEEEHEELERPLPPTPPQPHRSPSIPSSGPERPGSPTFPPRTTVEEEMDVDAPVPKDKGKKPEIRKPKMSNLVSND